MLPITKILCPTDFSEPSYVALDDAIELAIHFGAVLGLVHVVHAIPATSMAAGFGMEENLDCHDAIIDDANHRLHDVIEKRLPANLQTFATVCTGDYAEEVVATARDHSADLIVIATHGSGGWRHLVYGSVAEKIVQTAACPVLTVRRPPEEAVDVAAKTAELTAVAA